MSNRTDQADAVIALALGYCKAMLDSDETELRRIFHPKASVIGNEGGALEFASLDEFIDVTPDARTGKGPFDYSVNGVSLVGDMAVVTVSNYSFGAWYTDYLSMVICDGEWRIVAKTYSVHSPNDLD